MEDVIDLLNPRDEWTGLLINPLWMSGVADSADL